MTDTQIDIIQIKKTINDMQKNLAKIATYLQDEYFEDKIEKLYEETDKRNKRNEWRQQKRQQIDSNINYFIALRNQNSTDPDVIRHCKEKLDDLLDQDIDLVLEMYEDSDDSDDEILITK